MTSANTKSTSKEAASEHEKAVEAVRDRLIDYYGHPDTGEERRLHNDIVALMRARPAPAPDHDYIDFVCDGPPSHESGRFVEVEDPSGASIKAGEWIDRGNGLWALRVHRPAPAPSSAPVAVQDDGIHGDGVTKHWVLSHIDNGTTLAVESYAGGGHKDDRGDGLPADVTLRLSGRAGHFWTARYTREAVAVQVPEALRVAVGERYCDMNCEGLTTGEKYEDPNDPGEELPCHETSQPVLEWCAHCLLHVTYHSASEPAPGERKPESKPSAERKCRDGGRCIHKCGSGDCFREKCCVPFSDYSGPWGGHQYENGEPATDSKPTCVGAIVIEGHVSPYTIWSDGELRQYDL